MKYDIKRVKDDIAKLNSNVPIIEFSSHTGQGMEEWKAWLNKKRVECVGAQARFVTEE